MGFAEADVALALASTGGCMQPALEQLEHGRALAASDGWDGRCEGEEGRAE